MKYSTWNNYYSQNEKSENGKLNFQKNINGICSIWKLRFSRFQIKSQKFTLYWKTGSRWKSYLHHHLVLILTGTEPSIYKEHFPCGTFHINISLSTKILLEEAHGIKSRGALGTGFTYAPVLLFELYLAINHSSTSYYSSSLLEAGGKPST